ncbi:MAG TPA: hypothetical protein VK662_00640 [Acidothermaceae bacterium]|nr:hypothetical protein [Acidothermaceae bacterium]
MTDPLTPDAQRAQAPAELADPAQGDDLVSSRGSLPTLDPNAVHQDLDAVVDAGLQRDPLSVAATLTAAAGHPDPAVRLLAAVNPLLPRDLVLVLTDDPDELVSTAAMRNLAGWLESADGIPYGPTVRSPRLRERETVEEAARELGIPLTAEQLIANRASLPPLDQDGDRYRADKPAPKPGTPEYEALRQLEIEIGYSVADDVPDGT